MTIRIEPDGTIQLLYADRLRPMLSLGKASVQRASHVEPTPDGRWQADLSPVGGPVLPATDLREQSLQHEIVWIEANLLARSE